MALVDMRLARTGHFKRLESAQLASCQVHVVCTAEQWPLGPAQAAALLSCTVDACTGFRVVYHVTLSNASQNNPSQARKGSHGS